MVLSSRSPAMANYTKKAGNRGQILDTCFLFEPPRTHQTSFPPFANLLLCQLQQLLPGFLHLASRTPDGHFVRTGALRGKVDVHAAAVVHDGAHQAALGANQGVVQLGGDGDLRLLDIGLEVQERENSYQGENTQLFMRSLLQSEGCRRDTEMFLTSSLWIARIRSLAASQLFFLPVMTIISELLFSVGRSILVLVSSRICSQLDAQSHFVFFFYPT